ncbi:MAG: hypothetical protein R2823_09985 [Acidimicrobiia bacterium]
MRPLVRPVTEIGDPSWYPLTDPYVRRYWVAVLGPGAVADLLRLAAAAQRGRPLPLPVYLPSLLRERLVRITSGRISVPDRIPPIPAPLAARLAPALRRELVGTTSGKGFAAR